MDPFIEYRRNSKGFLNDPPARLHPYIMFGPGVFLTPDFIEKNNITHVINCASNSDVPSAVPHHFKDNYVCLNAIDSYNVDITTWFPDYAMNMNKFLQDKGCRMVYVNCQAGMNRSGFLTVLYSCMRFRYKFQDACRAVVLQRPCALMNPVFYKQVEDYIKKHS
jgi:protein-tyrosine phosphatase